MRIWDYRLLPYLPDLQFRGQLRELVLIMHQWRDKGKTNHLLINRVMEYPKSELRFYFESYAIEYSKRFLKGSICKYVDEFFDFSFGSEIVFPNGRNVMFDGWHTKEYLRVCMANLYEKHQFGIGKSRITDEEWQRLCEGYKAITGEEYKI